MFGFVRGNVKKILRTTDLTLFSVSFKKHFGDRQLTKLESSITNVHLYSDIFLVQL